eukprot:6273106-Amphidinium_carterae.1
MKAMMKQMQLQMAARAQSGPSVLSMASGAPPPLDPIGGLAAANVHRSLRRNLYDSSSGPPPGIVQPAAAGQSRWPGDGDGDGPGSDRGMGHDEVAEEGEEQRVVITLPRRAYKWLLQITDKGVSDRQLNWPGAQFESLDGKIVAAPGKIISAHPFLQRKLHLYYERRKELTSGRLTRVLCRTFEHSSQDSDMNGVHSVNDFMPCRLGSLNSEDALERFCEMWSWIETVLAELVTENIRELLANASRDQPISSGTKWASRTHLRVPIECNARAVVPRRSKQGGFLEGAAKCSRRATKGTTNYKGGWFCCADGQSEKAILAVSKGELQLPIVRTAPSCMRSVHRVARAVMAKAVRARLQSLPRTKDRVDCTSLSLLRADWQMSIWMPISARVL